MHKRCTDIVLPGIRHASTTHTQPLHTLHLHDACICAHQLQVEHQLGALYMAVKRTELKAWWGHRYGSSSNNTTSSTSSSSSTGSGECTAEQRAAETRVYQQQVNETLRFLVKCTN
jgi:hypothetical protein